LSANFVAKPKHAYGVDPRREEYYSLREARYDALADDIDAWAAEAARQGRKLQVIDVGCTSGVLFRHLEPRPHSDNIEIEATDVKKEHLYRSERYTSYRIDDLMAGNPGTPSNAFDVVVCEQVLEHLPRVDVAIASLERMARPGGKVCVGVPIFLSPLAFVRNRWIQASLILRPGKKWTHIQTFSHRSFLRQLRRHSHLRLIETRGFRIISGGPLRRLEEHRWWWRLNRRIGAAVPWACVEVQAILEKPTAAVSSSSDFAGRLAMLMVFFRHGAVALLAIGAAALIIAGLVGVARLSPIEIILGAALFYLVEYAMHRFAFHAPPLRWAWLRKMQQRLHYDHHVEPSRLDLLFLPLWFLAPNLLLTAALVALALGVEAVPSVMLGVMLAILHYEWVHYVAHIPYQPRTRMGSWMKQYHLRHHFISEKEWFGVSNPSLDFVFGTFRDPKTAQRSATTRKLHS
jgi:4-hydroxysphinganine ceramide fatty acyl 2-hydroxylase